MRRVLSIVAVVLVWACGALASPASGSDMPSVSWNKAIFQTSIDSDACVSLPGKVVSRGLFFLLVFSSMARLCLRCGLGCNAERICIRNYTCNDASAGLSRQRINDSLSASPLSRCRVLRRPSGQQCGLALGFYQLARFALAFFLAL